VQIVKTIKQRRMEGMAGEKDGKIKKIKYVRVNRAVEAG
jgi:hypothetical protein